MALNPCIRKYAYDRSIVTELELTPALSFPQLRLKLTADVVIADFVSVDVFFFFFKQKFKVSFFININ